MLSLDGSIISIHPSLSLSLSQHYENDADGLVTHLQNYVSKCGALDFDVKVSEFYDAGWVIPKDEVTLTSKLGKGEFGDVWEGKWGTCGQA